MVRIHLPPAGSQVRTAIGPPELPVAPPKQAQAPFSTGGPRVRIHLPPAGESANPRSLWSTGLRCQDCRSPVCEKTAGVEPIPAARLAQNRWRVLPHSGHVRRGARRVLVRAIRRPMHPFFNQRTCCASIHFFSPLEPEAGGQRGRVPALYGRLVTFLSARDFPTDQ